MIRALVIMLVLLAAAGCGPSIVPSLGGQVDSFETRLKAKDAEISVAKHDVEKATTDVDKAKAEASIAHDDAAHAHALADEADRRAVTADAKAAKAERDAYYAPLRAAMRMVAIAAALGVVLAGALIALSYVVGLPFGRTILWGLLVGCIVALVAAMTVNVAIDHVVAVVCWGFGAFAVTGCGWFVLHHFRTGQVAREGVTATKDALDQLEALGHHAQADLVRGTMMARQQAKGIHGRVVASLRSLKLSRGDETKT